MADVSILDIAGSQWDFKDATARSVLSRTNKFSTTEIKTGMTWINGKPIYRKVFNPMVNGIVQPGFSNADNIWAGFIGLQNADMVTNAYILNKRNDNYVDIYNSCNTTAGQVFVPKVGTNTCYIRFPNAYIFFVVIEYTKTLD